MRNILTICIGFLVGAGAIVWAETKGFVAHEDVALWVKSMQKAIVVTVMPGGRAAMHDVAMTFGTGSEFALNESHVDQVQMAFAGSQSSDVNPEWMNSVGPDDGRMIVSYDQGSANASQNVSQDQPVLAQVQNEETAAIDELQSLRFALQAENLTIQQQISQSDSIHPEYYYLHCVYYSNAGFDQLLAYLITEYQSPSDVGGLYALQNELISMRELINQNVEEGRATQIGLSLVLQLMPAMSEQEKQDKRQVIAIINTYGDTFTIEENIASHMETFPMLMIAANAGQVDEATIDMWFNNLSVMFNNRVVVRSNRVALQNQGSLISEVQDGESSKPAA